MSVLTVMRQLKACPARALTEASLLVVLPALFHPHI
jgi:hypothetical protein